ncbi:MAG: hypothetical protein NVS3B25_09690 [Hymenobacter sp.]
MTTKRLATMKPAEMVEHRKLRRMETLLKQVQHFAGQPEQLKAILNKIAEMNQIPTATKVCPHCDKEKQVARDFGYTTKRGEVIAQPWCRVCRGSRESHPTRYGL